MHGSHLTGERGDDGASKEDIEAQDQRRAADAAPGKLHDKQLPHAV